MASNSEIIGDYETSEIESFKYELSNLNEDIIKNNELNEKIDNFGENEKEKNDEKEESFTFKPVAISVLGSKINGGKGWQNNITTNIEFAGGGKSFSLYGYTRKDWNKYAKGFNEGIELFANENFKLGKNFDINGKQFYWGKGNGRLMVGPQLSLDEQFGKIGVGASVGIFGTYDIVSRGDDVVSGSSVISVNFSVEGKNGKTRNGDAFVNINGKGFDPSKYKVYGEASLQTPNILDSKTAGALCGLLYARYGGMIKCIKLSYIGVGLRYEF